MCVYNSLIAGNNTSTRKHTKMKYKWIEMQHIERNCISPGIINMHMIKWWKVAAIVYWRVFICGHITIIVIYWNGGETSRNNARENGVMTKNCLNLESMPIEMHRTHLNKWRFFCSSFNFLEFLRKHPVKLNLQWIEITER